jgi:hypothetical protein
VLLRELVGHKTIRTHDKNNLYVRRTYGTRPACRIVRGPYGVTYGPGTILYAGSQKAFENKNSAARSSQELCFSKRFAVLDNHKKEDNNLIVVPLSQ